ncbi:methyltransferase domain-containing protein [Methylocapsa aurea]|uniref:methyltransferase domain-containing protein n=1 Tax=Methylocapsa aurea TaxID=663610 RepID=UPI000564A23A|nr:methyltransferase domain-containing protein [Methylocapsa aurea]
MDALPELPPNAFEKSDAAADDLFYAAPRFVTHIDGPAIAAVTALYRELFPPGGVILDLMSSWISHLPRDAAYGEVIGHGMNAAELSANSQLSRFFVQNLNENPALPLGPDSVDAAAICVSVQYLQSPISVLRELARVLKADCPVAITFSNRCFPTKAVAIWQALEDEAHAKLVGLYLERAGFAAVETRTLAPPGKGFDPLWAVIGRARK